MPTLQPLPIDVDSDKSFWHGYTGFYEARLPADLTGLIVEFGVFKGNSVRWLLRRYPAARIVGVDILPQQPGWPIDEHVEYRRLDQGSESGVNSLFQSLPPPLLIIEDGSHVPSHQSRCLRLGFPALAPGGIYILEDIHTSHPSHAQYREEFDRGALGRLLARDGTTHQTALSVLLAFEHIKRRGDARLTEADLGQLAAGGPYSRDELVTLFGGIESIEIYRRATLPARCWKCGSDTYSYARYRCVCGVEVLAEADSMSVFIRKRREPAT
jgi:hypothetical protein